MTLAEQILNQLCFARAALKDDDSAHHADHEPAGQHPPGDLQDRVNHIAERRARQLERLIRHDICAHQSDREDDQGDDPNNRPPDRMSLKQNKGGQTAEHEQPQHDHQRVASSGGGQRKSRPARKPAVTHLSEVKPSLDDPDRMRPFFAIIGLAI